MTFRHALRFAVFFSAAASFTACGESENDGETQTTTGSPNDSNGTSGPEGSGPAGSGSEGSGTEVTPTTTGTTTAGTTSTTNTPTDPGPTDTPNPGFCPEEQPAAGAECTTAFPAACNYGETGCVCSDGAWECYSESDCPASAPADGDSCELSGMACNYGELGCRCDATDGWSCSSACPDAQPSDGASCRRPTNQSCNYAGGELTSGFMSMADTTCACSDEAFVCFSEANCPAEPPSTGGSCEFPTLDCVFEDSDCQCSADGTWECRTDCPDTYPDDGASCERPQQATCRYTEEGALVQGGMGMGGGAATSNCACTEGSFVCIGQEDCPAEAPGTGDACTDLVGLACDYEGSACNCGDMGWTCQTDCPAAPPEDGLSCERNENQACRYAAGELLAGGGFGGGGFGGGGFGGGAQADTSCRCVESAFDCFTPADCPMTLPGEDVECSVTGVTCAVEGQNCNCNGQTNTWTCFAPSDAGVPPGPGGMDTTEAMTTEAPALDAGTP